MEARRESLKDLAVALADRNDALMNEAAKQSGDIREALAQGRGYLAEMSSDLSDQEAAEFLDLYTEEVERRAESSIQYLSGLEISRAAAKEKWMVNGKISRDKIRVYVKLHSDALVSAAGRGENVHQMALDQQDLFHEQLILIPPEEADNFSRIYHEEINANSNYLLSEADRMTREAAALNQKTAEKIVDAENNGKVIGVIILMVIVVSFLVAVKH